MKKCLLGSGKCRHSLNLYFEYRAISLANVIVFKNSNRCKNKEQLFIRDKKRNCCILRKVFEDLNVI